jgi:hypothetical protein
MNLSLDDKIDGEEKKKGNRKGKKKKRTNETNENNSTNQFYKGVLESKPDMRILYSSYSRTLRPHRETGSR